MSYPRLAVLMACHNRRDQTLACLESVYQQDVTSDVYLVDDGSIDGTSDAVSAKYPQVKILQGDGNLYWGGAMRWAFDEAMKAGHDYYIWLNDDTTLDPDAFSRLLSTHRDLIQKGKPDSIIAGSMRDPATGQPTYGGMVHFSRFRPLKFVPVEPGEEPLECDTVCGNCVLIPDIVAQKVGNIDPAFPHVWGDWDYGLRAKQQGCSVWIVAGCLGNCSRNPPTQSWKNPDLPLRERWKKMNQIKGSPPRVIKAMAQRHAGPFWYIYWLSPYVRLLVSSIFKDLKHPPEEW
ncbi:MAG: glycosyltransferase family 2 protein [Phormidium sp.]